MSRRKMNADHWLRIADAVMQAVKAEPGMNTTKLRDKVVVPYDMVQWEVRQVMGDLEEAGRLITFTPRKGIYASTHWFPGKKTP